MTIQNFNKMLQWIWTINRSCSNTLFLSSWLFPPLFISQIVKIMYKLWNKGQISLENIRVKKKGELPSLRLPLYRLSENCKFFNPPIFSAFFQTLFVSTNDQSVQKIKVYFNNFSRLKIRPMKKIYLMLEWVLIINRG